MKPVLLALPLALTGCASAATDGPSLLPRAIEAQSLDEPQPTPPAPVAPDPALDARIAALVADATRAESARAAAERDLAPRLTTGARAGVGSDAWLDAQTALAGLEEQRAALTAVAGTLDELATARALAGQPPYPALDTAQAAIAEAVGRVAARLDARQRALPVD